MEEHFFIGITRLFSYFLLLLETKRIISQLKVTLLIWIKKPVNVSADCMPIVKSYSCFEIRIE